MSVLDGMVDNTNKSLLTGIIVKGLTVQKLCWMFVFVCFMFVQGLVLWRRVLKCAFAYNRVCKKFDRPEVTLCGWQDVKIQFLTMQ